MEVVIQVVYNVLEKERCGNVEEFRANQQRHGESNSGLDLVVILQKKKNYIRGKIVRGLSFWQKLGSSIFPSRTRKHEIRQPWPLASQHFQSQLKVFMYLRPNIRHHQMDHIPWRYGRGRFDDQPVSGYGGRSGMETATFWLWRRYGDVSFRMFPEASGLLLGEVIPTCEESDLK